jgi:hypothetical protein
VVEASRARRARTLAVIVACGMLLAAACGGDDDDSATPPPDDGATSSTEIDLGGGGDGDCFTDPGDQTARVRFVNLFTNDDYPEGDIQVFQGFSADDPCGEELATVAYGEVSDYIEVNAADESGNWSASAYIAGSLDDEHKIISQTQTWAGGEQVTFIFFEGDTTSTGPSASGSSQTFFEVSPSDGNTAMTTAPDGKAVIGVNASALQYLLPETGWAVGATGQSGCLLAVNDTETSATNVGGTSLVQYPVDPGSIELALYPTEPTRDCSGAPDFGPTTVEADAGSQTLVFAYGPSADAVDLLVLPVEEE